MLAHWVIFNMSEGTLLVSPFVDKLLNYRLSYCCYHSGAKALVFMGLRVNARFKLLLPNQI